MAKKQENSFGSNFNEGFKVMAHDVMLQTLREMAQEPEQRSQIAARDSTSARAQEESIYEKSRRPKKEEKEQADLELTQAKAKRYANMKSAAQLRAENPDAFTVASKELAKNELYLISDAMEREKMLNETVDLMQRSMARSKVPADKRGPAGKEAAAPASAEIKAGAQAPQEASGRPRHVYPDGTIAEFDGRQWVKVSK